MDPLFVNLKKMLLHAAAGLLPDWAIALLSILLSTAAIILAIPVILSLTRRLYGKPACAGSPPEDDLSANSAGNFAAACLAPLALAVVPFGRNMIAADPGAGILLYFAASFGTNLCLQAETISRGPGAAASLTRLLGWQTISFLSAVPPLLFSGSLSANRIVEAQADHWFLFSPYGVTAFVLFFVSTAAVSTEPSRSGPEPVPPAETRALSPEDVAAGVNLFSSCAMAAALFLGGWQGPAMLPSWLCFLLKTGLLIAAAGRLKGLRLFRRPDELIYSALALSLVNIIAAGTGLLTGGAAGFLVPLMILSLSVFVLKKTGQRGSQRRKRRI